MTKGQMFAAGIALFGDALIGANFYNSSGGDATFALSRKLSADEQATLKALGFKDYNDERAGAWNPKAVSSIMFGEWWSER